MLITLLVLVARSIIGPIVRTADMLKDISEGEGDLCARLEVKGSDEIGRLALYFNAFVTKVQGVVQSIGGSAESLVSSATEMGEVSTSLAASSDGMTAQANTAAAGTEEASSSVNTVASGIDVAAAIPRVVRPST